MSLTNAQILENLCYYDLRNPDNCLDDYEAEEIARQKSKKCSCDNCFCGRHHLAVELLAVQTPTPSPMRNIVDVSFIWDSLPECPEDEDKRVTAWGTKTKHGLSECLKRVVKDAKPLTDIEILCSHLDIYEAEIEISKPATDGKLAEYETSCGVYTVGMSGIVGKVN